MSTNLHKAQKHMHRAKELLNQSQLGFGGGHIKNAKLISIIFESDFWSKQVECELSLSYDTVSQEIIENDATFKAIKNTWSGGRRIPLDLQSDNSELNWLQGKWKMTTRDRQMILEKDWMRFESILTKITLVLIPVGFGSNNDDREKESSLKTESKVDSTIVKSEPEGDYPIIKHEFRYVTAIDFIVRSGSNRFEGTPVELSGDMMETSMIDIWWIGERESRDQVVHVKNDSDLNLDLMRLLYSRHPFFTAPAESVQKNWLLKLDNLLCGEWKLNLIEDGTGDISRWITSVDGKLKGLLSLSISPVLNLGV